LNPVGGADHAGDAPRVVAVVVSYNRRELVLETLGAVCAQDPPPAKVVLVENASTDRTADAVRSAYPDVHVVALPRNTGGAGGFALGVAVGLRDGADLLWLIDDDGVPEPGALAALLDARTAYAGETRPAAVASKAVWVDGRIHRMNVPRRRRGATPTERRLARDVGCQPMRSASFCSLLVDGEVARSEALPIADYFLWNDDFEYTARILRSRPGLFCPASVVVHKTKTYYNSGSAPGSWFFYDVRNMGWMLLRSRALAPTERLFFTVVTLRRWVRTLYRSDQRSALVRQLGRGLFSAVTRGPRPTRTVLADVWSRTAG
jgi:rhamnopyranosyl-N-acetylglucosaminyl-diphospho-decaprenol beta-1,3/1,4-galactofuranosyltransferase